MAHSGVIAYNNMGHFLRLLSNPRFAAAAAPCRGRRVAWVLALSWPTPSALMLQGGA